MSITWANGIVAWSAPQDRPLWMGLGKNRTINDLASLEPKSVWSGS